MSDHVIIVAGGVGQRMGSSIPKQFLELRGKPVIVHTIQRFLDYDPELSITVVIHPDFRSMLQEALGEYPVAKEIRIVAGGAMRFDSVKNGLDSIQGNGIIAIHDAVRPLVSLNTIDNCFNAALRDGAAIPVLPVTDSIRSLNEDGTSKAVDRSTLKSVQTPQCFQTSLLKDAYGSAVGNQFTDDASVVESRGHEITLVPGNRENIKITEPSDLVLAEALLNSEV